MTPATPKRALSDRDLADLAALSATPLGFAQLASRGRYDAPPHVRLIHDRLLALARRRITRLMIFAPPRHGKSFATSQYFPAWYLGMHPDHRILLASYGADFAATWGRKARDVLEAYGPLLYGVGVRPDSSAADAWNLADHDGGMNTAGVGGSQTGRGAHVFLIDDPFKNAEEALSPTYREKVWDWYTAVARTRLEPGGAICLMQTRWHEEDLPGKLIDQMRAGSGEAWHILSLPAIAEEDERIPFLCSPGEVYTRRAGEPLWPERFNHDALAAIRNTLESSFWWHALYQQRPTPHGGAIFQRAWFTDARRYHSLDAIPRLHTIVLSVDSAFQEGVASDYSVIAVWGTDGRDYYLLDVWRARVAYPDLIAAIRDVYAKWQPFGPHGVAAILIEKKASGQSAIQTLRRETHLPVIGVEPKGSKVARAELVSPLFQGGRCVFPHEAPWLADVIDEHVRFPRGKHDDIVDTSSQALTSLRSRGVIVADLTARLAARTESTNQQGTQPPRAPWSFGSGTPPESAPAPALSPTPQEPQQPQHPAPARHTFAHPGLPHPETAPAANSTAPSAPSADLLAALQSQVDARQQQSQQQQSSAADPSFVWPWQ